LTKEIAMRNRGTLLLTLLFLALGGPIPAQEGTGQLSLAAPQVQTENENDTVSLCFHADAGNPKKTPCNLSKSFGDRNGDGQIVIETEEICQFIRKTATIAGDIWYVATQRRPADPLYRIDCSRMRAYEFRTASRTARSASSRRPPPPDPSSTRSRRSNHLPGLDPVSISRRLERIEERLHAIERSPKLARLAEGQSNLEAKIDGLRHELNDESTASDRLLCLRSDGSYDGRQEVILHVGGAALRFLEIRPPTEPVVVGLTEQRAQELLQEAQQGIDDPIYPHLFLSVPEVSRTVTPYFLQDRLIDPGLYRRITGRNDARRVSHREARQFIDRINKACAGVARLALPTEEQLVAAGHVLYNPVENGLKPCSAVAAGGGRFGLTELLGHAWHLTSTPCEPFGDGTVPSCDEGSYIRKGGTASSENPLECIPEYRSTAPENVAQKDTSFRLVLVE
jgi:hypothetical protein